MQIPKRLDLSVLTSSLAFAIMKAHRSGKSIEAIERLLRCPEDPDGLTSIRLTRHTSVHGVQEYQVILHTQNANYEISIHPTTDVPQSCIPEVISVNRQGAERPCFRIAPIAITIGKHTLVKVPVSLLMRDYLPFTVAQQTLLLKTLVPDLPPTSPLLTDTSPVKFSAQTMVRLDRTGQPFVRIRFCVAPAGPDINADFHEFDSALTDATYRFNVGETKPHRCAIWGLNLSGPQMLIASMHAIQDIFANIPEWQLLYTSDYPHDHRCAYIAPSNLDLKHLLCRYATLRLNQVHPPFKADHRIGYTSAHEASYSHLPTLISEHFPPQQQTIHTFSFKQHKQRLYSHMYNLYAQQAHLMLSC